MVRTLKAHSERSRTCEQEVAGLTPSQVLLHSNLGKLFTPMCLCHKAVQFGTNQDR